MVIPRRKSPLEIDRQARQWAPRRSAPPASEYAERDLDTHTAIQGAIVNQAFAQGPLSTSFASNERGNYGVTAFSGTGRAGPRADNTARVWRAIISSSSVGTT